MRDLVSFCCKCLNMLHLGIFAPIAGCKLELDDTLCGQRICGPWFLDFAGLIGDLEFKRDILALIGTGRYYACDFVCVDCFAHKKLPDLAFDDFRPDAHWTLTTVSHEDYLNNTPVRSQHALLELIGYRQDPFM